MLMKHDKMKVITAIGLKRLMKNTIVTVLCTNKKVGDIMYIGQHDP
ncbi:hypothetical protein [Halobacillus litoralis]|nr:hypothetical protein [Halobacillus litoralis]